MNLRALAMLGCACALALMPLATSHAQAPSELLEFRRVFVPSDKLEKLTAGYLPVKEEEFRQLLSAAVATASEPGAASVRLIEATYAARLEQSNLVDGSARLTIAHENADDAILSLAPCSLAIRSAEWSADGSAARLGTDPAGKLAVVVEGDAKAAAKSQASELRFGWSLRGARDPASALVFQLQLPPCPSSRVELSLPSDVTPVVSAGVVTRGEAEADANRRRWVIELGGRTQTTLTIISDEVVSRRQRFCLQRTLMSYQLSPAALAADLEVELDIYREPVRQAVVEVDSALRIASVALDGEGVKWDYLPLVADQSPRILLEFAAPVFGHDHVLRITALARPELDRKWNLPRMALEDAVWQEGQIVVGVGEDLETSALEGIDARQASAAEAVEDAQRYRFQAITPEAAVQIVARVPPPRLTAQEGLTLKWDGPHLNGQLVSKLEATHGEVFELRGQLPVGWVLDGVETEPAAALDDWSVSAADARGSQLQVRLTRAIAPQSPLEIRVLGHRRAPLRNERLQPREYRMVEWQGVASTRRLVAVQTESQQQLALAGDIGLERLDQRSLSVDEQTLVDAVAARIVFVDRLDQPGFSLALRNENPRFAAETTSRLTLSPESLSELHTVRIVPDASPVSRAVVRFSTTLPAPVTWRLGDDATREYSVRQLASDSGELWEISFLRPQTKPVSLVAQRQTQLRPGDPPRAAPLVAVNEADSQQGEVIVEALDGAQPMVEQSGLVPAMVQRDEPHVRLRYAYQFASDQRLSIAHAAAPAARRLAWVWQERTLARVDELGSVISTIVYRIENRGASEFAVRLPEGAALRQVRVGATRLPAALTTARELSVPLVASERFVTVQVEYAQSLGALRLWQSVALPRPEIDLAVLERHAEVWLAPTLRMTGDPTAPQAHWRYRLFGPLARPAGTRAPSLFDPSTWLVQSPTPTSEERERAAASLQLLEQALSAQEAAPFTWGEWLERYETTAAEESSITTIRIDDAALADVGLFASAPVEPPPGERTIRSLLIEQGLAIVFSGEEALLTTDAAVPRETTVPAGEGIYYALPSSAASEGRSLAAWRAEPEIARVPWTRYGQSAVQDLRAAGWRRYLVSDDSDSLVAEVYRAQEILAIAWGLFLVTTGCTLWLTRHKLARLVVMLAGAAVVALWAPEPLVALTAAVCLGFQVGGIAALVLGPRTMAVRRSSSSDATGTTRRLVTASAFVLALSGALRFTHAQEAAPVAAYQVIVPIDDKQQPTGQYVYLPKPFYDVLSRRAKSAKAIPQGWLIYEASYRGQLHEPTAGRLQFVELAAALDLEVFQPETRVTIGLGRDHVHLLDDRVNLEGAPVRIDWLESGEGFTFPVEKSGRYRLEVALRPTSKVAGAREQTDLKIPPVAQATLTLKAPAEARGVQIAGALGSTLQDEPGSWRVQLGPTPQMTIHWPAAEASASPQENLEVAQWLWWKIAPGDVVLESQWKLSSSAQPISEVRLIADPRLKLLPLSDDQKVESVSVREGDVQAIQIALAQPHTRERTLKARFALKEASGVGRLMLPQLDAVGGGEARRWLGVSTTRQLEALPLPEDQAEVASPQEFAAAWESKEIPAFAYRLVPKVAQPVIEVRPVPTTTSARQALTFALEASRVRIELEAVVGATPSPLFQHRLQIPAEWTIDEATITQSGVTRSARIGSDVSGERTLFLPDATTAEHRLIVSASAPLPGKKSWALPDIRLKTGAADIPSVFIERPNQLAVRVLNHPGYEPIADGAAAPTDILWRRVAVLRPLPVANNRQIQVQVDRQAAVMRARQAIVVTQEQGAWQAVVEVHGEVTAGTLETLRFEVPAEVKQSRLSLAARLETVEVPGQTRQHVLASLDAPLSGKFTLQYILPLGSNGAERLQVPDVRLLDAETLTGYVVLPTEAAGQQLTWETRSLQATPAPREDFPQLPDHALVMLAPTGRFQANIKRLERIAGVPQVRLVEALVALPSAQRLYGLISLDLQPAGLDVCTLQVPAGQVVVHATVNGVSAVPKDVGGERYQIALQHSQLPQHIEVLFAGERDSSAPLTIPTLVDLPVERTLWTVTARQGRVRLVNSDLASDFDRQLGLRLRNLATLLDQAASQSADIGDVQYATWFDRWSRRQVRVEAALAKQHVDDESGVALKTEADALAVDARLLAEQWGTSESLTTARREAAQPALLTDAWQMLVGGSSSVGAMQPGAHASLDVSWSPEAATWPLARFFGVLIVALLFVVSTTAGRWLFEQDAAVIAPHVAGVAVGVTVWLLLWPAFAGLLIAMVFALSAVRTGWLPVASPAAPLRPLTVPRSRA